LTEFERLIKVREYIRFDFKTQNQDYREDIETQKRTMQSIAMINDVIEKISETLAHNNPDKMAELIAEARRIP